MKTHTRFLAFALLALCLLRTASVSALSEEAETNGEELYTEETRIEVPEAENEPSEENIALLKEASDLSWKIEGDTLYISGHGDMPKYDADSGNPAPWTNSAFSKVVIEDGITSVGGFWNFENVREVSLPNSVTRIEGGAFGNTHLGSIKLPEALTYIGGCAFEDTGITDITIPSTVTFMGSYAFGGCRSLKAVNIADLESWCNITFEDWGANPLTGGADLYIKGKVTTGITIPDTITKIKAYAFDGCSSIMKITLPDTVTDIGRDAFRGTPWYDAQPQGEVYIGNIFYQYKWTLFDSDFAVKDGTVSIAGGAFYGCKYLTSITLPNSVKSIGGYAFEKCTNLTEVVMTGSVTNIEKNAFFGCHSVTKVTVPQCVVDRKLSDTFPSFKKIEKVEICDTVTEIGGAAFEGCASLVDITIPNSVKSIGKNAFSDCTSVTRVTIPQCVLDQTLSKVFPSCRKIENVTIAEGATKISAGAFYGWYSLTSVEIPDSIMTIGEEAFYLCDGLTSITIPDGVTSIGKKAFYNCSSLESITIPESVTAIEEGIFIYCSSLESVTLPNSITSIGVAAFCRCSSLTSITIPESVTAIGTSAFSECNSLTGIRIPAGVRIIGGGDTFFCSSLTEISVDPQNRFYSSDNGVLFNKDKSVLIRYPAGKGNTEYLIPDSVTSIGEFSFWNCAGLKSITIPGSVTSIGNYAFSGCSSLTSVTIPDSVTSIGEFSFWNCAGLKSITIPDSVTSIKGRALDGTAWYEAQPDGEVYAGKNFYGYKGKMPDNTKIAIKPGTKSICEEAFNHCRGLVDVTIPDSVTNIGSRAFYVCGSLTSITIPGSVTNIGKYAFSGCSSLINIVIPDSVTSIGDGAFGYCAGLTSITIPDSVTNIGVDILDKTAWYEAQPDGEVYVGKHFYGYKGKMPDNTKIAIKAGTVNICGAAFYHCAELVNVAIPNSVTSIGNNAFYGCTGLISITIPNSVISIGYGAFVGCTGLTNITIPNSVTSIEDYAFYGCTGLISIAIPDSVTSIKESAFSDCTNLDKIYYDGSPSQWKKIAVMADNEAFLEANVYFTRCGKDTLWSVDEETHTLTISGTGDMFDFDSAEQLPWYSESEKIRALSIENGVTSVGSRCIYGSGEVESILFPKTIRTIANSASAACASLRDVYYEGTEEEWKSVEIGIDNAPLLNARIHFNYLREAIRITYDSSCDSETENMPEDGSSHGEYTIPEITPKRDGYVFRGWAVEKNSGVKYLPGGEFDGKIDTTLYAVWEKLYTLTYDVDGGSGAPDSQTAPVSEKLTISSTLPQRENFNFKGWSTERGGEVKYLPGDEFDGKTDTTLYAVWELAYTPGNIDGDDEITDRDAIYLLYHIFYPDLYPISQPCDFNGDGKVDDGDATYLLYYTFYPELYPLK